jgi:undecaprenyl diphosphate synthase
MTPEGTPSTIERSSEGVSGFADDPRAIEVIERMRRRTPEADPLAALPDVHPERIPRHVAIIMDGNGRWAEQRGFPRVFGHRNGAISVRDVVTEAGRLGIEALTLYSFSAENWKRPKDEIDALMDLCVTYCDGEREKLAEKNVHVRVIGRTHELPTEAREAIERLEATTASCTGPTLCLAINYGSRNEIVDAVRSIGERIARGEISPGEIDESLIDQNLYTAGLPDPDLMIRTGGEMRISNYLLWQLSYAELYVSDLLWPDFDASALRGAVRAFASRRRRFGGLDADAT